MKISLENHQFTHCIETSDWRYSAALLGLQRYLDATNKPYEMKGDALYYNEIDINEDDYWKVVDEYYSDITLFKLISNRIKNNNIDISEIVKLNKELNEQLKKLTLTISNYKEILDFFCSKTSFSMNSYEYQNHSMDDEEINDSLKIWTRRLHEYLKDIKISLEANNDELVGILEFLYPHSLKGVFLRRIYARFIDPSKFFTTTGKVCRLNGYNVDTNRKSRSLGYNFNKDNFVYQDIQEFDFIPFAFVGDFRREITTFFVNSNIKAESLVKYRNSFEKTTNKYLNSNKEYTTTQLLFISLIENNLNTLNDVEIICNTGTNFKDVSSNLNHTIFLRNSAIGTLCDIKEFYHKFNYSYEVAKDNWIRVDEVVTNAILNNLVLDDLINIFLKELEGPLNEKADAVRKKELNEKRPSRSRMYWLIKYLIDTNLIIKYGRDHRNKERLKSPRYCASIILRALDSKKVSIYRSKLVSSIAINDFDKIIKIIIHLSELIGIKFEFVNELLYDFETNKDLAYSFIHGLSSEN